METLFVLCEASRVSFLTIVRKGCMDHSVGRVRGGIGSGSGILRGMTRCRSRGFPYFSHGQYKKHLG